MASFNQNASYGRALLDAVSAQIPAFGNILVVVNSSDSGSHVQHLQDVFAGDSDGRVRYFASLASAYDAAESNNNDVIVLDAVSTHSLTTGLAVTKNRIHFLGFDGGDRIVQQGAKVELSGNVAVAYVMKNTGTRNTFRNIKFIQSSTNAAALNVVQDGSEGALYKNCSFVFGVANNLGGTTAHEFLAGTDSATFKDCTFGSDVLLTSGARSVFHIDQVTSGQEFKSNYLENCRFLISSSSGTATFVRLDAVGDVLFSNEFKNTSFIASIDSAGGAALAEAVQTGTGTTKGALLFTGTLSAMNCTKVSTATSGRNAAVQVAAAATSATGGIGIQPTA